LKRDSQLTSCTKKKSSPGSCFLRANIRSRHDPITVSGGNGLRFCNTRGSSGLAAQLEPMWKVYGWWDIGYSGRCEVADCDRLVEKQRVVTFWHECERNLRDLVAVRFANARRLTRIIAPTLTDIVTRNEKVPWHWQAISCHVIYNRKLRRKTFSCSFQFRLCAHYEHQVSKQFGKVVCFQ